MFIDDYGEGKGGSFKMACQKLMNIMPKLSKITLSKYKKTDSVEDSLWPAILCSQKSLEELSYQEACYLGSTIPTDRSIIPRELMKLSALASSSLKKLGIGNGRLSAWMLEPSEATFVLSNFPNLTNLHIDLRLYGSVESLYEAFKSSSCHRLRDLEIFIAMTNPISIEQMTELVRIISNRWPNLKRFSFRLPDSSPLSHVSGTWFVEMISLFKNAEILHFELPFVVFTGEELLPLDPSAFPNNIIRDLSLVIDSCSLNMLRFIFTAFPSLRTFSFDCKLENAYQIEIWEEIQQKMLCKNLESLTLNAQIKFDQQMEPIMDALRRFFRSLPNLKRVHFGRSKMDSQGDKERFLSIINECSKLERIIIRSGSSSHLNLSDFTKFTPSLKCLAVDHLDLTTESVAHFLQNAPNLQVMVFYQPPPLGLSRELLALFESHRSINPDLVIFRAQDFLFPQHDCHRSFF